MPLASEVTTWQEPAPEQHDGGGPAVRFRTRVRTNATEDRFKRRLEALGLLAFAETIDRYETNWHWTGCGQGYAILWRDTTTLADLLPLARL
ncbi:MAG: hypothetical protein C0501_29765 [Isosphaera sp.]|nr:hypothetical protein [Isosphaera sp.]